MSAIPVADMSDAELTEALQTRQKELRERIRWARALAGELAGCSTEAVLLGVRSAIFSPWPVIVREAKLAQLDIDQVGMEKRRRAADARRKAATAEWLEVVELPWPAVTAGRQDFDEWERLRSAARKKVKRADAAVEALRAEQDRIWAAREAAWETQA